MFEEPIALIIIFVLMMLALYASGKSIKSIK